LFIIRVKLQEKAKKNKNVNEIKTQKIFVYGVWARVDNVDRDGAQTTHVRSALVVANDISFGCLNND